MDAFLARPIMCFSDGDGSRMNPHHSRYQVRAVVHWPTRCSLRYCLCAQAATGTHMIEQRSSGRMRRGNKTRPNETPSLAKPSWISIFVCKNVGPISQCTCIATTPRARSLGDSAYSNPRLRFQLGDSKVKSGGEFGSVTQQINQSSIQGGTPVVQNTMNASVCVMPSQPQPQPL